MTARLPCFGILLLALALLAEGCHDKRSGRIALPGQTPNLQVTNRDNDAIDVYVDGGEIGHVVPAQTVSFVVNPGFRSVAFRETGRTFREPQGEFLFESTNRVVLTYDPSVTVNLRVTNNDTRTIDVIVGVTELGSVPPAASVDFLVESGRRDLFFRERGETSADYVGTFNFNTSGVVTVSHP